MTDPHTSMSLAATLVLTVVVMVLIVGWLAVVFLAGREPGTGSARLGSEGPARVPEPGAVPSRGGVPAGPGALRPAGRPAPQPGDDAASEPLPHGAGQPG
jgi:hypothetical protein